MTSPHAQFALLQRLSRLDAHDEAGSVCGATPPGAALSVKMRRCVLKPHGETQQHDDGAGYRWPEVVQRRIDLVPERRR